MYHQTLFYYVEIFEKNFLLAVKAKYLLLETRMLDVETELRRLGDDFNWLGGYS